MTGPVAYNANTASEATNYKGTPKATNMHTQQHQCYNRCKEPVSLILRIPNDITFAISRNKRSHRRLAYL